MFKAATDEDKPQEELKYQVQSCWWGVVTLTTNLTTALNYFTQKQVNKGLVVFRHHSKYRNIYLKKFCNVLHF